MEATTEKKQPKRIFKKKTKDDFLEMDVLVAIPDGTPDRHGDGMEEEWFGKKFEVKRVPLTINFNKDFPPIGVAEVYKLRGKIRARLVLKKTGLEVDTLMDLTPCLGGNLTQLDALKHFHVQEVSLAAINADSRIKSLSVQKKEG